MTLFQSLLPWRNGKKTIKVAEMRHATPQSKRFMHNRTTVHFFFTNRWNNNKKSRSLKWLMFEIFNKNSNFQPEKKVDLSSPIYFHFIGGVVVLYQVSVAHYKMADMETYNSNIIMGNTQDQSVFTRFGVAAKCLMCRKDCAHKTPAGQIENWTRWCAARPRKLTTRV